MKQLFTIKYMVVLYCPIILLLLSLSCTKEEDNPVTPTQPSLTNSIWILESLSFSYSGTLIDQSNWKTSILNSGLVTIVGTVSLLLTDTSFSIISELDNLYASYFPSRLTGTCNGKLRIENGFVLFHSRLGIGTFELGRDNQEAYATYSFSGNKLIMFIVIPTYQKTDTAPGYVNVGEEYYRCVLIPK